MGKVILVLVIIAAVWVGVGLLVKYVNCLGNDDKFELTVADIKPVLLWPLDVFF